MVTSELQRRDCYNRVRAKTAASATPHIKTNRLKALAVTSAQPSDLFPGLPTIATSGVPGYEAVLMLGMFAPAKTPVPLTMRLNQEIARALAQADVRGEVFELGRRSRRRYARILRSYDESGNGAYGQSNQGCWHPRRIDKPLHCARGAVRFCERVYEAPRRIGVTDDVHFRNPQIPQRL
jgi:hypothetical protein